MKKFLFSLATAGTLLLSGCDRKAETTTSTTTTTTEAAATTTATFARMDSVDFSNIYFVDGQRLLVKADSTIKSVRDLAGKRVGTAQGSTSEVNIKAAADCAAVDASAKCG